MGRLLRAMALIVLLPACNVKGSAEVDEAKIQGYNKKIIEYLTANGLVKRECDGRAKKRGAFCFVSGLEREEVLGILEAASDGIADGAGWANDYGHYSSIFELNENPRYGYVVTVGVLSDFVAKLYGLPKRYKSIGTIYPISKSE